MTKAIQKVIDIALAEEGYLEKASNKSLDSKTANAGAGNYTKYWRDVYPQFQALAWCACFVAWCFMQAFGLETAKKMLKHWPYTYCPTLAAMTTNKTPKVGSIILFYRNGEYAHTGIVTAVTATTVYTIEGNTSGASGIISNGGGVCRKSYARASLSSQTKYFMPDYSLASETGVAAAKQATTTAPQATQLGRVGTCSVSLGEFIVGSVDPEIKTIQRMLNAKGYKGKDGKKLEVDGELGENTAYAITKLQKKAGMKNINFGTVSAKTWALILK